MADYFHIIANSILFNCINRRCIVYATASLNTFLPSKLHYSPGWALASSKTRLQASRFLALSLHPLTPIFLRSVDTSSSHVIFGLPLHHFPWLQHGLNIPCTKCQIFVSVRSRWVSLSHSCIDCVARLTVGFHNSSFFSGVGLLAPRPTPSLEDQGISFCLGHHLRPVQQGWPYQ